MHMLTQGELYLLVLIVLMFIALIRGEDKDDD